MRWLARVMSDRKSHVNPIRNHGRTFRQCRTCGRLGWFPEADAELCCGQAMAEVEPRMTVADYARFIGCERSCQSGAITRAEVAAMMRRDGITPVDMPVGECGELTTPYSGTCSVCGKHTKAMLMRPDGSWCWLCPDCSRGAA